MELYQMCVKSTSNPGCTLGQVGESMSGRRDAPVVVIRAVIGGSYHGIGLAGERRIYRGLKSEWPKSIR